MLAPKARVADSRHCGELFPTNYNKRLLATPTNAPAQRTSILQPFFMKSFLFLAGIFACNASMAQAQTVLPSGAVAPAGSVVAPSGVLVSPATVPGSQPLSTPATRDGGSPRAARHNEKVPGLSRQDRRQNRKIDKMHYTSDAEKQAGKK